MKLKLLKFINKILQFRKTRLRKKADAAASELAHQLDLLCNDQPNTWEEASRKMNIALEKSAKWNNMLLRIDKTYEILQNNGNPAGLS